MEGDCAQNPSMSDIRIFRQEPFHVCCGFSFAIGSERKTAGKNSQPFQEEVLLALSEATSALP